MFEITHINDHGFDERWPAGRVYAEAMAEWLCYRTVAAESRDRWYWLGPAGGPKALYVPGVEGSPVEAKCYEARRMLSVYLMDPTPEGVTCRMLGEPWDDDRLLSLIGHLGHLPYGHLVGKAIIAHADWLDLNPWFRGIPVKQIKAHRYAPGQLEVTGPRTGKRPRTPVLGQEALPT